MARAMRKEAASTFQNGSPSTRPRGVVSARQRGTRTGQPGASPRQPSRSRAAAVAIPITHLVAGMRLPISKSVQQRYGVGEHSVDTSFLESSGTIYEFFVYALNYGWASNEEVDQAIMAGENGSPMQSSACFDLVNTCLERLGESVCTRTKPFFDELYSRGFEQPESGGFEILFGIGVGNTGDMFSVSQTPRLRAQECGLSVMTHDLSRFSSPLKQQITQFVHFCSCLSHHATTIGMLRDDSIQWMSVGEIDLTDSLKQRVLDAMHDEDELDQILKYELGEDYLENSFVSAEGISDYVFSLKLANEMASTLLPLSRDNVCTFLLQIEADEAAPSWLIQATTLMLNTVHWDLDMDAVAVSEGYVPFSYMMPFGFNLPCEQMVFEMLHETSMNGEELSTLSVDLNEDTVRILANLDIGEKLLLFADQQLSEN